MIPAPAGDPVAVALDDVLTRLVQLVDTETRGGAPRQAVLRRAAAAASILAALAVECDMPQVSRGHLPAIRDTIRGAT